jgi:thiosulfate/3-mercaptopyruvate sulfurtransferase
MRYTTLVTTDTLANILPDPSLIVVDSRFDLADTDAGERAYVERHIQGAVYAHLDRDLSGQKTGQNGRHPLPRPALLALTFGRLGIGAHTQVVVYDQDSGMFASRVWWMLRWLGHDEVAVLDGGFAKWSAENRPTRAGAESKPVREFAPRPRPDMVADEVDVRALLGRSDWRLLDARAPERFRGETEPLDRVPGHIPGAVNHFFKWNLDEAGAFRPADDLRKRLRERIGSVPPQQIVCYCGSGVTACHNLLAFEHAGLSGGRLYAGSWSEWAADPARPIETGPGGTGGAGGAGRP